MWNEVYTRGHNDRVGTMYSRTGAEWIHRL